MTSWSSVSPSSWVCSIHKASCWTLVTGSIDIESWTVAVRELIDPWTSWTTSSDEIFATVFELPAWSEEWKEDGPLEWREDGALGCDLEDETTDDATMATFFLEGSSGSIEDCLDGIEVTEEGGWGCSDEETIVSSSDVMVASLRLAADGGIAVDLCVDIHMFLTQAFSAANRCSTAASSIILIITLLRRRRSRSCCQEGMTTSCSRTQHYLLKLVEIFPPFIMERGHQSVGLNHIISYQKKTRGLVWAYLWREIIIPCWLHCSTRYVCPKKAIPVGPRCGVSVSDNSSKGGFELQY